MASRHREYIDSFNTFTETRHTHPAAATDPSRVHLPQGYTVCIIGASRGIGAATARCYAQAGATNIILTGRDTYSLVSVAKSLEGKKYEDGGGGNSKPALHVDAQPCDISSEGSVAALAKHIQSSYDGRLDAVVVNAGVSGSFKRDVTVTDPVDFALPFQVNFLGTFYAAHALAPLLLASAEQHGTVAGFVAVNSMAAHYVEGETANVEYSVSKLAQARLVEMVHHQLASRGLFIVALHPGGVATDLSAGKPELEHILPYLVDSPELCGAFCVWLTKEPGRADWLGGRFLSSNWDVEQLQAKKQQIVDDDLLKFRCTT